MDDTAHPDPFDALRRPDAPIAPRPAFTNQLRRRLLDELADALPRANAPERITTMSITPYLMVRGAAAAIDFYRNAFGAIETQRLVGDDGRIGHAEVSIGGARVMLADEYPEMDAVGPQTRGGATCTFDLDVGTGPGVDATFERAMGLGAVGVRPPADQFHGSRSATIIDPFGHRWTFSAQIEELTTEEYAVRAAQDSGHGSFDLVLPDVPDKDVPDKEVPDKDVPDHQLRHHANGDLYYFTLPVNDLPRAQRFFETLLGWQFGGPDRGHIENISAPPGSIGAIGTDPADAIARLWFVVDDIHDGVATVRRLGGTATEPVEYDSGWSADCTDDQGTVFSLSVPSAAYSLSQPVK